MTGPRRQRKQRQLMRADILARAEQRTVWLVTWLAGTVAGAIGWAGLEAGVGPWLGARRAAILRIVAFVRSSCSSLSAKAPARRSR